MSLKYVNLNYVFKIFEELSYFQIYSFCNDNATLKGVLLFPDFKNLVETKLLNRVQGLLRTVHFSEFKPNNVIRCIKLRSTPKAKGNEFYLCHCQTYYWVEEYSSTKKKKKIIYCKSGIRFSEPYQQLVYLVKKGYIV